MPLRRPPPSVDAERLMKRIDERFDQALQAMLNELGTLRTRIDATQFDVRLGNQKREEMAQRLSELEMQVIETRQHLQVSDRAGLKAAQDVASTAIDAAKAVAETAPKNVWKAKLGLVTMGSAAFVAIVSLFSNLPKFVRGASEIAVEVYGFLVRHR